MRAGALATELGEQVYVVDAFLSPAEVAAIDEELDYALWRPGKSYMLQPDGTFRDELSPSFRKAESTGQQWFTDYLNRLMVDVERRLEQLPGLDGLDPACLEGWQATRYGPGDVLEYHHDSGYWDDHYAGDRTWSFVLYLDTPQEGGGTHFRALDLYVEAVAGRLLFWHNLFPHGGCDHRKIHSSTPVVLGRKATLVTWLRQRPYRFTQPMGGQPHGQTT